MLEKGEVERESATYQVDHTRKQRRTHARPARPSQHTLRINMEPRSIGTNIRHRPPRPIELSSIRTNVLAIGRLVVRDRAVGDVEVIIHGVVLVGGAGKDVGEAGAGCVVTAVDGHFGVWGVAGGVGADCGCSGVVSMKDGRGLEEEYIPPTTST